MKLTKLFLAMLACMVVCLCSCKDDSPAEPVEYTLNISNDGKGTATATVDGVEVTTVEEGVTVTLTATATPPYKFKQWTVESGEITLSGATDNPATFIMPSGVVSINAEFYAPGEEYGLEMARIPAGTFLMGSPASEPDRTSWETQHQVTLTKSFWMSKYEITNAQYADFLNTKGIKGTEICKAPYFMGGDLRMTAAICKEGENKGKMLAYDAPTSGFYGDSNYGLNWDKSAGKWKPAPGCDKYPVTWVTWFGAVEYAKWIGGAIPTEAQWEYACRGGQTESLPFGIGDGSKLIGGMANFDCVYPYDMNHTPKAGSYVDEDEENYEKNYKGHPVEVGSYPYPNGYGLYDMHGNVNEWCLDLFSGTHPDYDSEPVTDPTGPTEPWAYGVIRVLRGGYYTTESNWCRTATRYYDYEDAADNHHGFRVIIYEEQ